MSEFSIAQLDKNSLRHEGPRFSEDIYSHVLDHVEYVPFKGIMQYLVGATHPKKGFPTPEAVLAINQVKVLTKACLYTIPMLVPYLVFRPSLRSKFLALFNDVSSRILAPYYIQDQYMCPTSYNTQLIAFRFLKRINIKEDVALQAAVTLAHIFEYDDAYRYQFQDMAYECDVDALEKSPVKEIKRLLNLYKERSLITMTRKVKKILLPLVVIFLIPSLRKAFKETVAESKENIKAMSYDESDWYWCCLRDDYFFKGINTVERMRGMQIPPAYKVTI